MLGVIGVNHICAHLSIREQVSQALIDVISEAPNLSSIPSVLITTCGRTEWYFSSSKPLHVQREVFSLLRMRLKEPALHTLYSYFGVNGVIHLHRVVSGLDSAFFGETEIQGQIKLAYGEAVAKKKVDSTLHYLFQKALHAGKVVRKLLPRSSLIHYQLETKIIDRIKSNPRLTASSPVLLIGASVINQRICQALKSELNCKAITVANRTEEKAREFARRGAIAYIPLQKALAGWQDFSCIIAAVKTTEYLICATSYSHVYTSCQRPALIIDLGVPRNIDPEIHKYVDVFHNIETLFPVRDAETEALSRSGSSLARSLAIQYYRKVVQASSREFHYGDISQVVSI